MGSAETESLLGPIIFLSSLTLEDFGKIEINQFLDGKEDI